MSEVIAVGGTHAARLTGQMDKAGRVAQTFGKAPASLVREIEGSVARLFSAAAAANASIGEKAPLDASAPELRAPDMARVQNAITNAGDQASKLLSPEAKLTFLMAMLQEILGELSLDTLRNRLELFTQRMAQLKASNEAMSERYQSAHAAAEVALNDSAEAGAYADEVTVAAEEAHREADRLKADLDATSPDDAEHEVLASRLRAAVVLADNLASTAQRALEALDRAIARLDIALTELEHLNGELERIQLTPMQGANPLAELHRTNAAKLNELLAVLQKVIATNSQLKLQSESEFAIKMLKAREAENLRRSEEYQEQLEKARDAEKKMGCIGKIIGWVITVISVVAAPFTGGASLALAAVGLALAITEEITGESILGKALEPLITHVLQPLINAISKAITGALKGLGVDDALAKRVGAILGAVVGAVVMIVVVAAAVVLGKGAASRLATKLGDVLAKNISKIVPEVLKNASKAVGSTSSRLSGALTRTLGMTAENMASRTSLVVTGSHVAQFGNQTAQGVGGVIVADMRVTAAKILAALKLGLAQSDLLRDMMSRSYEDFTRSNDVAQSLYKKISDVAAEEAQAGRFILKNIRRA